MTKHTLLLASNNRGKLSEMIALLHGLDLQLLTPADLGLTLQVKESGSTYAENAALKAQAFSQATGLLTLADDSGLEVFALGGQPGLHSARFSPKAGATDADRRLYLLERLQGKPRPWLARFVCVIALTAPDLALQTVRGECQGEILPQERGQNGFGYDPLFYFPELGRTMAELSMEEKNRLSHRARAVQAAIPIIRQFLKIDPV